MLLLAISVPVYLRGDIRAVEAQFRSIEVAVGNIPVLRVASAGIGPWVSILLAGVVILGVDLIRRGEVVWPVLAIVGLTVFTVWHGSSSLPSTQGSPSGQSGSSRRARLCPRCSTS